MKENLVVFNTLSGKKEKFEPLNPPFVGMYVCGPTVYSNVHLGNARTFVSFDLIYRYLTFLGYKVRYVRNITDAGHLESEEEEASEDKISKKARLEKLEPMEVVQQYTVDFHRVMEAFNTFPPSIEPTATGHILEQIEMIQAIIDKGLAYETNGSVYFDVKKYNEQHHYGKLSGRKIEDLYSGTRELDGQSEKRDPLDFALWKKASPAHIMRWNSPWGTGFPGWHLECSVMSNKYLGDRFDIHGGGMDLKFPHHECEIAQNQAATGHESVKYWLHTNMLTFEGTKMSKSLGNSILPHELFSGDHQLLQKGFSPMVVRFFMMQAHYRSTLDFSNEALKAAEKGFQRLMAGIALLDELKPGTSSSFSVEDFKDKFYAALNDDFNSPVLISHLFEAVKTINSIKEGKESLSMEDLRDFQELLKNFVFNVLGLVPPGSETSDNITNGLMQIILDMRQQARMEKNWAVSDFIRDRLQGLKVQVKDSKDGATWQIEN